MKIGMYLVAFDNEGYGSFGDEKFLKVKSHGFDAIDYNISNTETLLYSLNDKELEKFAKAETKAIDDAGLTISQVHGPWRWPPEDGTIENRNERMEKMKKSIVYTGLLGCKYWVVHPLMPFGIEEKGTPEAKITYEINLEFMRELLAFAKGHGVTICLENMPMPKFSLGAPEDILKFVKEMNDENFKICFDTGHAQICSNGKSIGEFVELLGEEIKTFHIHDNNGVHDLHLTPLFGCIDWNSFSSSLKKIGFNGVFSLETAPSKKLSAPLFEEYSLMLNKISKSIID